MTMYFQRLELWENKFLYFKPTILCFSVAVAAWTKTLSKHELEPNLCYLWMGCLI